MASPYRPVTESELQRTKEVLESVDWINTEAASILGISEAAVRRHRKKIIDKAKRGDYGTNPIIPGFEITKVSTTLDSDGNLQREHIQQRPERDEGEAVPEGHTVRGMSTYLDGAGRVIGQWVKTQADKPDPTSFAREFRAAFEDYSPPLPKIPTPDNVDDSTLALYPLADWHIGVSAKRWNLNQAKKNLLDTSARVVAAQHPTRRALMVIGGDFTDIDNILGITPRHGHVLNPSDTYKNVVYSAAEIADAMVQLLLQRHELVDVVAIPGNHDETTYLAIKMFLDARYRNEPRVTVTDDEDGFYCYTFGKVMLFFHHGHEFQLKEFAGKMAGLYGKEWGMTDAHYGHCFHVHHKKVHVDEHNGAISESHQSPAPKSQHIRRKAYIASRGIQSILYHEKEGDWGRVGRPIREWK